MCIQHRFQIECTYRIINRIEWTLHLEKQYNDCRHNIINWYFTKMSSSQPQRIVTFSKIANARTGNILFQYLFCVRISILFGHKYVAIEDLDMSDLLKTTSIFKITDSNIREFDGEYDDSLVQSSHVLCEGFFQRDEYYLPIRERILDYLRSTDDSWIGFLGQREYIRDFLSSQHSTKISVDSSSVIGFTDFEEGSKSEIFRRCDSGASDENDSSLANDIVMSLRLDDFIQLPNPRSDIIPMQFYMDILEKWFSEKGREDGRLLIVSDRLRHNWENKYVEHFAKWSPIMVQNTLLEDFALMRDCPALIHSNSSLCWFASFLSRKKRRFIPRTGTYSSQRLWSIDVETDTVIDVKPMEHAEVYALNVMCWHRDLTSLPYCLPDEIFVESVCPIDQKKYVISPLIPGDTSNYLFKAGEEAKYYDMYRQSMFAVTQKKGGWDCLRHYEILAAGCIPIFEDLDKCPADTLVSFPKDLLKEAYRALLPWRNTDEQREAYNGYTSRLLDHAKSNCSASANVDRFIGGMKHIGHIKRNVLMLTGDMGVNYTRELNWIGIKRQFGISAVEYPPLDYLYDDFPEDQLQNIYGNGFTYSRRLSSRLRVAMTEEELIESLRQKKWDMIIYGKVGPDETAVGSVPLLPYWSEVFKRYSRDEIVFWYGGDGMQDLTYANRYSDHLVRNSQYARCFVRELIKWEGKV